MIHLLLAGTLALLAAGCSDTPDPEPAPPASAPAAPPPGTPPDSSAATSGSAAPAAGPWTSALFPSDEDDEYAPRSVSFGGRTWRLIDYSYSGYRLGAASLAAGIPCRKAGGLEGDDITTRLQAAVNTVGQAGGGTVVLPAGRFTVRQSIEVPFDNVSILGAGSERTLLHVPAEYAPRMDPDEGVFTFGKRLGGWNKAWVDRGAVVAEVTAPVERGQSHVDLRDAARVNVGDWIIVSQYHWPGLSQRHSGGRWPSYAGFPADPLKADREFSFAFLRQVRGKAGSRVTLDAPIPWRLDPADNPVRLRTPDNPIARLRSNVGLAGVSIEFADNHGGANDRPAGSGVYFEGVRDGWVFDVDVRNFPRNGIYMDHAARITVLDSAVTIAQDAGVGGYGYGIQVKSSQNVLLKDTYVGGTRHGFTSRGALTSLLVHTQNTSARSSLEDDLHFGVSQGVLWDDHQMADGTGMLGIYRGAESGGAHESLGDAVYWNVRGDGAEPGHGALRLNPSSTGWAIVVGATDIRVIEVGQTLAVAEPVPAKLGLQVLRAQDPPGPGSRDGNVLYESVGRLGLAPPSIYEAQLEARLHALPAAFTPPCG